MLFRWCATMNSGGEGYSLTDIFSFFSYKYNTTNLMKNQNMDKGFRWKVHWELDWLKKVMSLVSQTEQLWDQSNMTTAC